MNKQYYSVTEAAKLKKCSRQYILELLKKNKIPGAIRLGDSTRATWMIPVEFLTILTH